MGELCFGCGLRPPLPDDAFCEECNDGSDAPGSTATQTPIRRTVVYGAPEPKPRYVDPGSLEGLFAWACLQAEAAQTIPPIAIHQAVMPRDHAGARLRSGEIIRARPFTVAFERYVDGETDTSPIAQALEAIHSDPSLRLEHEIAWAIVEGGHTDLELLYAVLGRPNAFHASAVRGLRLLRDKTTATVQKRLAETSQRRETAGQAQQARAEDNPKKKRKGRVLA